MGENSSVHRLVRAGHDALFVKRAPDLSAEYEGYAWCKGRLPVPEVLDYVPGEVDVLVTRALSGAGAHDRVAEPDTARVTAVLAEALRLIHALPTSDCPFVSYTAQDWMTSIRPK